MVDDVLKIIERIRVLKEKGITSLCIIGNIESIKRLSIEWMDMCDYYTEEMKIELKDKPLAVFMGLQIIGLPITLYAPDAIMILTDRDLQILNVLKSFTEEYIVNFDDIPEDREESYPCKCGGNITQKRSKSGRAILDNNYMMIWECDRCDFEIAKKVVKDT